MRQLSMLVAVSLLACTPINVDRGYGFSCKRDSSSSSQCPGEFHCGLENKCIKNAPGPWQCESDVDCFGWRCGVANRCYDTSDAGSVGCRTDDDCNAEARWRCDPGGTCVDSTRDGPRPTTPLNDAFAVKTRQLWRGSPAFVEVTDVVTPGPGGSECPSRVFLVDDVDEECMITVPTPVPGCALIPSAQRLHLSEPVAVGLRGNDIVTLAPNGAISRHVWNGSVFSNQSVGFDATASQIRVDDFGWTVFGADSLTRIESNSVWSTSPDAGHIRDVVILSSPGHDDFRIGVLTEKFQTAPLGDGGTVGPFRIEKSDAESCGTFGLRTRRIAASQFQVIALGDTFTSSRVSRSVSTAYDAGCPGDWSPWALEQVETAYEPSRCETVYVESFGLGGSCLRDGGIVESWPLELGHPRIEGVTATARAQLTIGAFAGQFPTLHLRSASSGGPPISVLWDTAPDFVTNFSDTLAVWSNDGVDAGYSGTFGVVSRDGLISKAPNSFGHTFGIRGLPRLFGAYQNGAIALLDLEKYASVLLEQDDVIGDAILSAASKTSADGGTLILLGRGDVIANVTLNADQLVQNSPLRNGFAPAPRLKVRAIDLAEDLLGAAYAGGYAVAGGRVFRFVADNPVVWRSTELEVGDVEAIDVWHDGLRGRAGLRDGTVVALPSRTVIAPPTSGAARAFLQVCERLFVATEDGVDVLTVDADARSGRWVHVVERSGAARLHFTANVLTAFFDDGAFGELPIIDCTQ